MTQFDDIELSTTYRGSSYKTMLGDHLTSVLDLVFDEVDENQTVDKNFKFSTRLYWECIEQIHDKNFNTISEEIEDKLSTQKLVLYKKILSKLGIYFREDDVLLSRSIDFTVNNYFENIIFTEVLPEINPWKYCDKIFTESHLLYSFSDNKDEYKGMLRQNYKESELSKELTIGVLRKGARSEFGIGYIKDNFAIRKLFLDILDEKNHNSKKPIKIIDIFELFRIDLGISVEDLSDNNISNWILKPLKKITKVGSNKEGYFIIRDEDDLYRSYWSHYKNYLGFYDTLERHRKYSEKLNTSNDFRFKEHIKD